MISKLFKILMGRKEIKKLEEKNFKVSNEQNNKVAKRKGEIGEYKINFQLEQLSNNYKYLSDLLIRNKKSSSGYSQIDHLLITPYGIFVIETKNYQGSIKGNKDDQFWILNGRFKMYSPLYQNYGHIKALETTLQDCKEITFISLVSFTMRCRFNVDPELRKITSNQLVAYDVELTEFVERKLNILKREKAPILKSEEIQKIWSLLLKENITDPNIRKEHENKAKSEKTIKKEDGKCVVCGVAVNEKVKEYCLKNNKKFNGKIYCYEHQKTSNESI